MCSGCPSKPATTYKSVILCQNIPIKILYFGEKNSYINPVFFWVPGGSPANVSSSIPSVIIIIIYFENVAFFQAKIRRLPQGKQPNLWRHFDSTTKLKNRHQPVIHPWVLEPVFMAGYPSTPTSSDQGVQKTKFFQN